VLALDYFAYMQTPQPELHSSKLSLSRLKKIALGLVSEGNTIWINGREYIRRKQSLKAL